MKVGFIGLGQLGSPIAMNLLECGHQFYVYNRTESKTTVFKNKGAIVCNSVQELASQCNIVFTIVSDDAALKSICEGEQGLIKNLSAGSIHVSMSTILPKTADELYQLHKQQKQHYLATPVFGRPEAAAAKKLNFVIAGDAGVRKQIEPLLKDAGATGIWDFGDSVIVANTVKLCGNFMIAAAMEAMGESISLAKKSGVDINKMWSMFTQTLFNAPIYINYGNIIINQKFEPASFTMQLGLKDMKLVLEQAGQVHQSMPSAELIRKHMEKMIDQGKKEIDWSAITLVVSNN